VLLFLKKCFPGRVDALAEADTEIPTVVGRGRGRCRDRVDAVEKLDTRSKRFRLDLSLDWTFPPVFCCNTLTALMC
jgi:hypothetical protein